MTTANVMEESLAKQYEGHDVRVYLTSGTILSGKLRQVTGYEALISDHQRSRESLVNLTHVISISRM